MSNVLNKMFGLELSSREEKLVAAIFLNKGKSPFEDEQLQQGLDKLAVLPESWGRELALQILVSE